MSPSDSPQKISDVLTACSRKLNDVSDRRFRDRDIYINILRQIQDIVDDPDKMDAVARYIDVTEPVRSIMSRLSMEKGHNLGSMYFENLLDHVLTEYDDRELIKDIVAMECYSSHIPLNLRTDDVDTVRCPDCGTLITGRSTSQCSVCNFHLRKVCPLCNAGSSLDTSECPSCGYPFDTEDLALGQSAERYNDSIESGNLVTAGRTLDILRSTYPHYRNLPIMEERLEESQRLADNTRGNANRLYYSGKYNAAMKEYEQYASSFPEDYSLDNESQSRLRECTKRVKEAGELLGLASRSIGTAELGLLQRASRVCPDHPKVLERVSEFPPLPPKNAKAVSSHGGIMVTYDGPDDPDVSYSITRVEVDSGRETELEFIRGKQVFDRDAPPGMECTYRIHSKRGCVLSRGYALTLPAMSVSDVTGLTSHVDETGIHLDFTRPVGSTATVIVRESDAEVVEYRTDGDGFTDSDVDDRTGYRYHVRSEFRVGSEKLLSDGLTVSVKTFSHPDAVRDLNIRRTDDGRFLATWKCGDRVCLFLDRDVGSRPRGIAPLGTFHDGMVPINPTRIYDDGMEFELDVFGDIAIVPVSVLDGYGCEGARAILTIMETFSNVRIHPKRDQCLITMDWPDKANWAEIDVVRGDDVQSHTFSRYEYNYGSISVPLDEGYDYECRIHAIYDTKSVRLKSDPVVAHVSTRRREMLSYTVSCERHGSVVEFEVPQSMEHIPRMVAVRTAEGIPLSPSDGFVIWDSEDAIEVRQGKATIYAKGKEFDSSTRLFFADTSEYQRYSVMHPLGRRETI